MTCIEDIEGQNDTKNKQRYGCCQFVKLLTAKRMSVSIYLETTYRIICIYLHGSR